MLEVSARKVKGLSAKLADEVRFIRSWAENPLTTGAVSPSGPDLTRRMAAFIEPERPGPVLEIGPGTGVVTHAILERGMLPSRVIALEYNEIATSLRLRDSKAKTLERLKRPMLAASKVPLYSISSPGIVEGVDFSDHRNYWRYGYPAMMLTDTAYFRNPNYHARTDTIDTLDFEKMALVIEALAWGVLEF